MTGVSIGNGGINFQIGFRIREPDRSEQRQNRIDFGGYHEH